MGEMVYTGDMDATATQYLATFDRVLTGSSRAPYVTRYSAEEITERGMVPVVFGETGCLVIDHGDGRVECGGLFSGGPKGSGLALLDFVVEHYGVNYVECFAPLHEVYARGGFATVSESPWNPDYAPEGWHPSLGVPNYHEMMLV